MPEISDECWTRVKGRLRAEVGEAVYSSWFARMELESVEANTARISVPTLFLKSWIQSHYAERLLTCWQSERPAVTRIDLSVRTAAIRTAQPLQSPPRRWSPIWKSARPAIFDTTSNPFPRPARWPRTA